MTKDTERDGPLTRGQDTRIQLLRARRAFSTIEDVSDVKFLLQYLLDAVELLVEETFP